jgi:hypothetical protein
VEKTWAATVDREALVASWSKGSIMEWTIRLEAKTGWGEVTTCEIGALHRSLGDLTADGVGLALAEGKALLAALQQRIVQSQIDEYVTCARVCPDCLKLRLLRDQRTRTLQTLFGTVKVAAPRIRLCACADTLGLFDVSLSPVSHLLPDRCTGELRRLQTELGARHSFREATRLLETFLPCSPPNHVSVRNRLHRVAGRIEADEAAAPPAPAMRRQQHKAPAEIVVMIDGAHLRAVPDHASRHLDVTVGKVETAGRPPRRFALAPLGAQQPAQAVRAALLAQGWHSGRPVTVISDGEPALLNLVRTATGEPVRHILDWWHVSIRVRHIEQSLAGVYALRPTYHAGLDFVRVDVERLRHLIWNGYADEAGHALWGLTHLASEAIYLNGEHLGSAVRRFLLHNQELRGYLANNEDALIDYGTRYRAGRPVSTSRRRGLVGRDRQRADGQAPTHVLVAVRCPLCGDSACRGARRPAA